METLEWVDGGVTAPKGFQAAATHAGVKYKRDDVALLVSDQPAHVAGVFTTNRVQAAPVQLCRQVVAGGVVRAVLVNSGNANALTGEQGWTDALALQQEVARVLRLQAPQVAVCSTGVIGVPLPMERLLPAIAPLAAALTPDGGTRFARAIWTTDTQLKQAALFFEVDGKRYTVGGAAKGSGMIHPNLATMLAFLTTDAALAPQALDALLRHAVKQSFHRISVDGDTSTNDTVLLLANGAAGGPTAQEDSRLYKALEEALTALCITLAKAIAQDGEGATKRIDVTVQGARSEEEAERAARAVIASTLVKTAVWGADPNWGRVLSAIGASGVDCDLARLRLFMAGECVFAEGRPTTFDERQLSAAMQGPVVPIVVDLGGGSSEATCWGCDLTPEYVHINGSYRT